MPQTQQYRSQRPARLKYADDSKPEKATARLMFQHDRGHQ